MQTYLLEKVRVSRPPPAELTCAALSALEPLTGRRPPPRGEGCSPRAGRSRASVRGAERCRVRRGHLCRYHVFYYLLAGASAQQRDSWKLGSATAHVLSAPMDINASMTALLPTAEHCAAMFAKLCSAMRTVGVRPESQVAVFELLSGILHLCAAAAAATTTAHCHAHRPPPPAPARPPPPPLRTPLPPKALPPRPRPAHPRACPPAPRRPCGRCDARFVPVTGAGHDSCQLQDPAPMRHATRLLCCSGLERHLTSRTIRTGNDLVQVPMTAPEAASARDAVCKAIYSNIFDLLVVRVNETASSLSNAAQQASAQQAPRSPRALALA